MEIDENDPILNIGLAAKKLNIAVPTMRMYEKAGLIIPYRNETGRRYYSFSDLKRISFIRKLIKKESMNLAGIRRLMALLPCWKLKPCSATAKLNCPAYHDCRTICWLSPNTACHESSRSCRECPVYRQSCDSTDIFKSLLNQPND